MSLPKFLTKKGDLAHLSVSASAQARPIRLVSPVISRVRPSLRVHQVSLQ